jgi:hypothetical protein
MQCRLNDVCRYIVQQARLERSATICCDGVSDVGEGLRRLYQTEHSTVGFAIGGRFGAEMPSVVICVHICQIIPTISRVAVPGTILSAVQYNTRNDKPLGVRGASPDLSTGTVCSMYGVTHLVTSGSRVIESIGRMWGRHHPTVDILPIHTTGSACTVLYSCKWQYCSAISNSRQQRTLH